MGKQTSNDVREIVIDLHKKGKSLHEIRKIVGRNRCTTKTKLETNSKNIIKWRICR